ncbi:MAG: hypothetical protein MJE77_46810 [Proteobacteria bacterium]|nr:hypothetical protein [Pseudomonadota bacterium]
MLLLRNFLFSKYRNRHRTNMQLIESGSGIIGADAAGASQTHKDCQRVELQVPELAKLLKKYQAWDRRQLKLYVKLPVPAAEKAEVRVALNGNSLLAIHAYTGHRDIDLPPYTEQVVELPLEQLERSEKNTILIEFPRGDLAPSILDLVSFWLGTPDPDELHDDPPPYASEPNRDEEPGRKVLFHNPSRLEMELVWVDSRGIERNPLTLEPRSPCKHSGLRIKPNTVCGPLPSKKTTYPGSLHRLYLVDTDEVDNLAGFHVVNRDDVQSYYIQFPILPYDSTSSKTEVVTVTADVEKLKKPAVIAGLCYELRTVLRYQGREFSKRGFENTLNGLHLVPSEILQQKPDDCHKAIEFRVNDFETKYGAYEVHEHPHGQPSSDPDDTSRWTRFREGEVSGLRRVVEVPFLQEREFNYCIVAKPVSPKSPLALASDPVDYVEGSGGTGGGSEH